jgi:hypothetical protein
MKGLADRNIVFSTPSHELSLLAPSVVLGLVKAMRIALNVA